MTPGLPDKRTLNDVKNLIVSSADNSKANFELDESALGNRAINLKNKADGLGTFKDEDFTSASRGTSTAAIKTELEEHKALTDQLNDIKKEGLNPEKLEKAVNKDLEKLKNKAGKVFGEMNAITEHHGQVVEEITLSEKKFLDELKKDFDKKSDLLSKKIDKNNRGTVTKEFETLKSNYDNAVSVTKDKFEKFREAHIEARNTAKNIIEDLEKSTGMKAADHLPSKAVVTAEKAAAETALKTGEKVGMMSRMGQNLTKGGFMGKAKVGAGALIGGGMIISGLGDLSGRKDEQGNQLEAQPLKGAAKILVGALGGGWLAAHR